jgi:succinyl-diaminopimelate desuccinylase
LSAAPADLLELTSVLVDIPSLSGEEAAIAGYVADVLAGVDGLESTRIGDNVVARTHLGRESRIVLAGHLDTVPAAGNDHARLEKDRCGGLGSADMKGGVAVALELARTISAPRTDVTFVFYACEETGRANSGLAAVDEARPDLLAGDAAILLEPTSAVVEAGCQGVMRLAVRTQGRRAHVARPWTGVNAIHRLGTALGRVAAFEERRPVLDGCEYRESLQAVSVEGGVAGNVVPDLAIAHLSYRFAPDRDTPSAFAAIEALIGPALDASIGDALDIEAVDIAAPPSLDHPFLSELVEKSGEPPRAKLGWTDVAHFAERGIPAANFGPGDPELAHRPDEFVTRADLDRVYATLRSLIEGTAA